MNKNHKLVLSCAAVTFTAGLIVGIQDIRIRELKNDLALSKIKIDFLKRSFKAAVVELTPEQRAVVTDKIETDIEFTQIALKY